MEKIILKNKIINDKYTDYVYEAFDIQNKEETTVEIPVNFHDCKTFNWNIGVIYGGSGTGKTTLLKKFGLIDDVKFDNDKSLISNFDWLEPSEATKVLSSMGLSSVPTWLRPFNILSNGEQYRAKLAYLVAKADTSDTILVDEYTSVVDRDVAKAMSNALQKYIRRENKKIILASCHFDIMEWLQPDWIYSPIKGRVERPDCLRRESIKLQIYRCRPSAWSIYKQHHYLTQELHFAAICYQINWNDKNVAFLAILPFPGVGDENSRRISRIVVLPDFQGLGIGKKLIDYISGLYLKLNHQMYIRTMNPTFGIALTKDTKNWMATGSNLKIPGPDTSGRKLIYRPSYSFKYIGPIIDDDTRMIEMKSESYQYWHVNDLSLF